MIALAAFGVLVVAGCYVLVFALCRAAATPTPRQHRVTPDPLWLVQSVGDVLVLPRGVELPVGELGDWGLDEILETVDWIEAL